MVLYYIYTYSGSSETTIRNFEQQLAAAAAVTIKRLEPLPIHFPTLVSQGTHMMMINGTGERTSYPPPVRRSVWQSTNCADPGPNWQTDTWVNTRRDVPNYCRPDQFAIFIFVGKLFRVFSLKKLLFIFWSWERIKISTTTEFLPIISERAVSNYTIRRICNFSARL